MPMLLKRVERILSGSGPFGRALAEFGLIVVGVLVALGIDAWYEGREDARFEQLMLSQIATALERDLQTVERLRVRLDTKERGIEELLGVVHRGGLERDAAFIESYDRAWTGVLFVFDSGPYEALKLRGLERLEDPQLQTELIDFYDLKLPRLQALLRRYLDQSRAFDAQWDLDLVEPVIVRTADGELRAKYRPVEDVLSHPSLLRLVLSQQQQLEWARMRLDEIAELSEGMAERVDAALAGGA